MVLLVFFSGGVGVREHSRDAAAIVLILYLVDTIAGPSALRVCYRCRPIFQSACDVDCFHVES